MSDLMLGMALQATERAKQEAEHARKRAEEARLHVVEAEVDYFYLRAAIEALTDKDGLGRKIVPNAERVAAYAKVLRHEMESE